MSMEPMGPMELMGLFQILLAIQIEELLDSKGLGLKTLLPPGPNLPVVQISRIMKRNYHLLQDQGPEEVPLQQNQQLDIRRNILRSSCAQRWNLAKEHMARNSIVYQCKVSNCYFKLKFIDCQFKGPKYDDYGIWRYSLPFTVSHTCFSWSPGTVVLCLRQLCISELVFRPFPVEVRFFISFMFLSIFLVDSKCLLIA